MIRISCEKIGKPAALHRETQRVQGVLLGGQKFTVFCTIRFWQF